MDKFTKEIRSKIMASVRSRGNRSTELATWPNLVEIGYYGDTANIGQLRVGRILPGQGLRSRFSWMAAFGTVAVDARTSQKITR